MTIIIIVVIRYMDFVESNPLLVAGVILFIVIYFFEMYENFQQGGEITLSTTRTDAQGNVVQLNKLLPSTYELTRTALGKIESPQQARSVRGQSDVWKQITPQGSKFFSEEKAKQLARQAKVTAITSSKRLPAVVKQKQDALARTFLEKAAQVADTSPELAATLISGQGLAGYLKASGKTRKQVAEELGVSLEDVDTLASSEREIRLPDMRSGIPEEMLGKMAPEQQSRLKNLMKDFQIKKTSDVVDIEKADPKFKEIQTNLIKVQEDIAKRQPKAEKPQGVGVVPPRTLPPIASEQK